VNPQACANHHYGPWMIDIDWLRNEVAAISAGIVTAAGSNAEPSDGEDALYRNVNGIAVVSIAGPMMKIRSKFGGTSTVDARNAVRKASNDPAVSGILLHIDSPGGTVAGTEALAQDVASANARKPVHAHIEDMGASAAYYVASQARQITASKGSLIGSLGTRMAIVDSSVAADNKGLKVHDISTGPFKGAGLEGTKITEEQLAYFQQIVDDGNRHFKQAVMTGRRFSQSQADALFDGRVHDANTAKTLGLIDNVASLDAAMTAILQETSRMNAEAFNAYAAEHPEAVAKFMDQGKKAGAAEARNQEVDRLRAINAACPGRPGLAINAFLAGQDVEGVKLTVAALDAEAKAKDEQIAALQAKADKAAFLAGTQPAVPSGGAKKPEEKPAVDPNADPEAVAKTEWTANADGLQSRWVNEKTYVAFRKAEIRGQVRERPVK
jgi:signal peptide peptidase SppA